MLQEDPPVSQVFVRYNERAPLRVQNGREVHRLLGEPCDLPPATDRPRRDLRTEPRGGGAEVRFPSQDVKQTSRGFTGSRAWRAGRRGAGLRSRCSALNRRDFNWGFTCTLADQRSGGSRSRCVSCCCTSTADWRRTDLQRYFMREG